MRNKTKGFTLIELLIVVAIIAILAAIAVPNFLEAQVRAKVSRVKADMRSLATAVEAYVIDFNVYPYCNSFGIPGNRAEIGITADATYLENISTPIAYMTNAFLGDPFLTETRISPSDCTTPEIVAKLSTPSTLNGLYDAVGLQFKSFMWQSWNGGGRTIITGASTPGTTENPPGSTPGLGNGPGVGRLDAFANASVRGAWGDNPNAYFFQSGGPDRVLFNAGGIVANCEVEESSSFGSAYAVVYDPTNGTISFGSIWRVGGVASGGQSAQPNTSTGNGRAYGDGFTNVMYRAAK